MKESLTKEELDLLHKKLDQFVVLMRERIERQAVQEIDKEPRGKILLRAISKLGEITESQLTETIGGVQRTVYDCAELSNLMLFLVDILVGLSEDDET